MRALTINCILIAIGISAILYLTSAFIFSTFDISKWDIGFKGFTGFLNLVVSGAAVSFYIIERKEI